MSVGSIRSIGRLTEALLTFYVDSGDRGRLLSQVDSTAEYLAKEGDLLQFLKGYGLEPEAKKEVLVEMAKGLGLDELLSNCLNIMVDTHIISSIELFLSTLRSRLLRDMNIKNVYVYSSFPIDGDQVKRLEALWKDRLNKECHFHYAIDGSLRMGIKVQVDMYIEEYSLSSRIRDLKIKLDTLLGQ